MDDQILGFIKTELTTIRTGQNKIHDRISDGFTEIGKRFEDVEDRVDDTESWIDKVKGGAKLFAILSTVVVVIAGILIKIGVFSA